jgi:hypothetical protein
MKREAVVGVTRNGACTEQGLDFPESCAALVILRMRGDGVDKQSLVAVWAQSGVDVVSGPDLGGGGKQGDELRGVTNDPGQVTLSVLGDEEQVEVGTEGEFGATEPTETDDSERGGLQAVSVLDDLEGIADGRFGQGCQLGVGLGGVGQIEEAAQADAQLLGLLVASEPQRLVGVGAAMPQVGEGFVGGALSSEVCALDDFLDEIWGSDGDFSESLGPVEEPQEQLEEWRRCGPCLVEGGPAAVGLDETIETGEDPVGIGKDALDTAR